MQEHGYANTKHGFSQLTADDRSLAMFQAFGHKGLSVGKAPGDPRVLTARVGRVRSRGLKPKVTFYPDRPVNPDALPGSLGAP